MRSPSLSGRPTFFVNLTPSMRCCGWSTGRSWKEFHRNRDGGHH